ncbi:unnamed protein product [Musa textilis]
MTPESPKPSCHEVVIGKWMPSDVDRSVRRVSAYGTITNIINGGVECWMGSDANGADRIGFYKRYYDILNVSYGDHLDCYEQKPF